MSAFSAAKKIFSCAIVLGMLTMPAVCRTSVYAEGTDGKGQNAGITEISDAAGLAAIAGAPDGSYLLTEDIDLSGSEWTPIAFSGRLDGGGHTIYNLHITDVGNDRRTSRDGNLKKYDTQYAGLFSVLENAEISELSVTGALVEISGKSHCFAAVLAGYSDSSVIRACSVSGRVHMQSSGVNAGIAGMVGYGTADINYCDADVELVFEDNYRDGKCEQFLGGMLSSGVGDISHCNVSINGYVSCHGYVHNGGLAGMYYHIDAAQKRGNVKYNSVSGQISFFEDNRDRRAYCKDIIGERLTKPLLMNSNTSSFRSNETKDYSQVLSPEKCGEPDYEETVVPPGCEAWGYTRHRCRGCGYSWNDTYTHPRHTDGEWVTVSDSDSGREGLERQYCAECGEMTGERAIAVRTAEKRSGNMALYAAAVGGLIAVGAGVTAIAIRKKRKAV